MAELQPWRPANGTEGLMFEAQYCSRCQAEETFHDDPCAENACPIARNMFNYRIDDPLYPKQVVIEDGRPRCVAFHRIGAPDPIDPNAAVGDLFG